MVAVESGRLGLGEQRTPNLPIVAISDVLLRASGRTVLDILPKAPNCPDHIPAEAIWREGTLAGDP